MKILLSINDLSIDRSKFSGIGRFQLEDFYLSVESIKLNLKSKLRFS